MEIIFILIPIGIILLGLAIWAFFWAVKNDQFDDLEGPAYTILFDDPADQDIDKKTETEKTSEVNPNLDQTNHRNNLQKSGKSNDN